MNQVPPNPMIGFSTGCFILETRYGTDWALAERDYSWRKQLLVEYRLIRIEE